ncbi:MAG: cupredoxin domain-containing protein [Chloroflexota bacterium]|nr:cupredoxin domain-containing protein [Chloroflexota bacterium]MDE3103415.1 cupredoxin domain-containing protein [Chloroflexota bacterium]
MEGRTARPVPSGEGITRRKALGTVGAFLGAGAALPLLAACSGPAAKAASSPTQKVISATLPVLTQAPVAAKQEVAAGPDVKMTVLPGELKGPDGLMHDAFVPSGMVLKAGVPATVAVTSYDDGKHSVTCKELGLDETIKGGTAAASGDITPAVTTFTFTPKTAGVYRWHCDMECDSAKSGHWAMTDDFDKQPGRLGYMAGWIVVLK